MSAMRREQRFAAGAHVRALPTESVWRDLYRVGGAAALGVVALFPIQMIVYIVSPPPTSVSDWFALFQRNPLVGLLDMDLLLIVDYVLLAVVFLALATALRRTHPSWVAMALVLELVAAATYFASTAAFEMLSFSNQYAAATTEAERSIFLAAGHVMLATWQGTAFDISYVLSGAALLIISVVMLRSQVFGRRTAYLGIAGGAAALVPSTAGSVGLVLSLVSLLPLMGWLVLVARRLFRLTAAPSATS